MTANSSIAAAIAPVANELKTPIISSATTAEPLKITPWWFKINATAEGQAIPVARYGVEKAKVKRPVAIFIRDNEGNVAFKNYFKDYLEKHDIKFISEESILSSDTDFSAIATKVASLDPDSLWISVLGTQAGNLVLQLKQAGLSKDVPIFGGAGLGEDYRKAAGSAAENTFTSQDYNVESSLPFNKKFVDGYKAKYKISPNNFAAIGYTEARVAALAIKRAMPNPTRDKVRDQIAKIRNELSVLGTGTWGVDENRMPVYELPILLYAGGVLKTAP